MKIVLCSDYVCGCKGLPWARAQSKESLTGREREDPERKDGMRADKIQNAMITFIVSLFVLMSGCLLPVTYANVSTVDIMTEDVVASYDEKLSSDNDIVRQDAADGNTWRSMNLFTRTEQVIRSGRVENCTYFISILAVLFKIAVISRIIMFITRVVWQSSDDVLERMMHFVHDSDGKKNK